MNEASFKISFSQTIKLLKEQNLIKQINTTKDIGKHSAEFKKASRSVGHIELYNIAMKNQDYELLLFDDSIFQFSYNDGDLRYAYIQNPQTFATKQDFINKFYSEEDLIVFSDSEIESLIENINENDYEQFINEQNFNIEAHTIRYDLDVKNYNPLKHSYSHIHIGTNENLRIACSKVLTPLKFGFFCIKNTYYKHWKDTLDKDPGFETKLQDSKKQCADLPKDYWIDKEKFELYLH